MKRRTIASTAASSVANAHAGRAASAIPPQPSASALRRLSTSPVIGRSPSCEEDATQAEANVTARNGSGEWKLGSGGGGGGDRVAIHRLDPAAMERHGHRDRHQSGSEIARRETGTARHDTQLL